jgi:hypothetical protein
MFRMTMLIPICPVTLPLSHSSLGYQSLLFQLPLPSLSVPIQILLSLLPLLLVHHFTLLFLSPRTGSFLSLIGLPAPFVLGGTSFKSIYPCVPSTLDLWVVPLTVGIIIIFMASTPTTLLCLTLLPVGGLFGILLLVLPMTPLILGLEFFSTPALSLTLPSTLLGQTLFLFWTRRFVSLVLSPFSNLPRTLLDAPLLSVKPSRFIFGLP